VRSDFRRIGSNRADQPEGIFARQDRLGNHIESIFAGIGMAVHEQAFAAPSRG
jgi:hypothetical protein